MNRLSPEKQSQVISALVEGNSIRATVRMTGVAKNTVTRLPLEIGRPTNAFSKKVENLAPAVALHFMHHNFCRVHQTLRLTPAMEAGIAEHVWSMEEVVNLLGNNVEENAA